ncbi:uncharacterized protein DUF3822 [Aquimarina sp. MAR_2010_214]|uniref:DUF3822 family protein n=1 Tax=Aquimarina sp. MAR_2010_214 TaxID=1250026 RepID=UPI000C707237|nr:DUF3822 family protein [Aquimarina sp. MAR_2010_214]PKV50714.1 uncharacterized protein DUF3822 [Aquimarina sp. MAR_2010_214]
MVQTINNIIDNTSKTLSIQVSLNGLSFCTVNTNNQITSIEHETFGIQLTPVQVLDKIKYTLDHNQNLKGGFDAIEVIYQNDLYTIVPKPLFSEKLLNEYLKFNTKVLQNDFIAYDELNPHNIVTVYIPYTNINNFFFDTFGSFTYKHSSTILINSLLTQEKNNDSITVYANMNDASFDIIVINKGNLILSNTYKYQTKEDFLYYLLYTTEQLQLNPEEFRLVFLGDISRNSEFFNIAYTYIRHISFGSLLKEPQIIEDVTPFEPHNHFVLLSHF